MTTIHTFIIVASILQWHISQMNVKKAFLNGDQLEEVYMIPSQGILIIKGSVKLYLL